MSRERERRSAYKPTHAGHPTILYVRNISDRVRYDDLRHLFQKYGKIVDVTIPLDYYSGLPKGYCFVEFEDPRDAEEAHYRMARQRLFGREIEIEFARGDRKTASEMRTRAKDRRGGDRYEERDDDRRRGGERDDDRRRGGERRRERSRSRSGGERRRSPEAKRDRSKSREANSYSRSRSRSNPRNNKNHSPQPARSVSRDRSRTRSKSRTSPRGEKMMNSRSVSPA